MSEAAHREQVIAALLVPIHDYLCGCDGTTECIGDRRGFAEDLADAIPAPQSAAPARMVTSLDELEALPDDSVIRDDAGWVYDKQVPEGWVCAGNAERNEYDIKLPATVLTPAPEREVVPVRGLDVLKVIRKHLGFVPPFDVHLAEDILRLVYGGERNGR